MSLLQIEGENQPTVYELSVGTENKSLIISVHNKVYSKLQEMLLGLNSRPWFLSEELNLPQFIMPGDDWPWWEFGPVASRVPDQRNNFTSLEVILPRVVRYPPGYELAKALNLQKEPWEENYDYTLWHPEVNWDFAHAVSATLTVLFKSLSIVDVPSTLQKPQLVEVDMYTKLGNNPISVVLGKALLPYLHTQQNNSYHQNSENVMETAYTYMMGKNEYPALNRFEVWFRENRWVNLTCPGDRCGLDPNGYYNTDQGYEIYSHNVDSVAQQLTLLMGIAAIHQEAREIGF